MNAPTVDIANRLIVLKTEISRLAQAAGRDPAQVSLLAVSKTKPVEDIAAALTTGHRQFGENRVQEAKAKFTQLRETFPDIELHLIGPLQTNKAVDAVRLFDVIETLDSEKLAAALAAAIAKTGKAPRFYIEVNIGDEPQKAGIRPADLPSFLKTARDAYKLAVDGLMCIPPQGAQPAPFFAALRALAQQNGLDKLSMGMSGDYADAIAQGSTEIRIGTAIFGERSVS